MKEDKDFMNKDNLLKKSEELANNNVWDETTIEINKLLIDLFPAYTPAYTRLAFCYINSSQEASAVELYDKVLQFDKNNIIAQNGIKRITKGASVEYYLACVEFNKLKNRADKSFNNYNNIDLINVGNELALLLSRCIIIHNDLSNLCKQVVIARLTLEDAKDALNWINKININDEKIQNIRDKLIEIINIQGNLELEDIQYPYMLNQIASIYKELTAFQKSISILEISINKDDKNIYTYNAIGGNYKLMQNYSKAFDYYSKALDIKPNYASLIGIGAVYRAEGKYNDAMRIYNEVLEDN